VSRDSESHPPFSLTDKEMAGWRDRVRGQDARVTIEHGLSWLGRKTRHDPTEGVLSCRLPPALTRRWRGNPGAAKLAMTS